MKNGQRELTLLFPHTPSFRAWLTHWHYDTFEVEWQDPAIPGGLLTFVIDRAGQVLEMRLDQQNLPDVDFSELHPIKRTNQQLPNTAKSTLDAG